MKKANPKGLFLNPNWVVVKDRKGKKPEYMAQVFRRWVKVVAYVALALAILGGAIALTVVTGKPTPATVMFTDGTTAHCKDGYWHGSGFGADNLFACDGTDYPIQTIKGVSRP